MIVAIHATPIRASAERIFSVYGTPQNITAVTGVPVHVLHADVPVRAGSVQRFAVGPRWLHIRWEATIEEYIPPLLLVDVQTRGPFRQFRHAHCIVPLGENQSVAIDIVQYEWRSGRVGRFIDLVLLKPLIALLIRDRHRRLARLLHQTASSQSWLTASRDCTEEVAP
jgi:ligand-binding SRPBCC domain-containing protein